VFFKDMYMSVMGRSTKDLNRTAAKLLEPILLLYIARAKLAFKLKDAGTLLLCTRRQSCKTVTVLGIADRETGPSVNFATPKNCHPIYNAHKKKIHARNCAVRVLQCEYPRAF
jgi:hypothetical protein